MRAWILLILPSQGGSEGELERQGLHPHKPLCVLPESPGSRHRKTETLNRKQEATKCHRGTWLYPLDYRCLLALSPLPSQDTSSPMCTFKFWTSHSLTQNPYSGVPGLKPSSILAWAGTDSDANCSFHCFSRQTPAFSSHGNPHRKGGETPLFSNNSRLTVKVLTPIKSKRSYWEILDRENGLKSHFLYRNSMRFITSRK